MESMTSDKHCPGWDLNQTKARSDKLIYYISASYCIET
jgi:hypothetical protein